jgi:hypothetical protein
MSKFRVTVSRSASHNLVIELEAESEEAAEEAINEFADQSHRWDPESELPAGAKIVDDDFCADDESSFEIIDVGEA